MIKTPLVTVFIPVYNSQDYLKECLDSIINQTYKNLEILIVDDGSTDNSLKIMREYEDKRINIIKNNENRGLPYTRNVGLENAKGDYLVIMDADDIAELNRVQVQVQYMEENRSILASGSYYKKFWRGYWKKFIKLSKENESIKIHLLFDSEIANPSAIIRLYEIKKLNIKYNISCFVAQDYDFWVEISKYGELANLPHFLLNYRVGHGSITQASKIDKLYLRKQIIDSIQRKALLQYGFDLSKDQLEAFHKYFNFNQIQSEYNVYEFQDVIIQLIEDNRKKKIFNELKFEKILLAKIILSLSVMEAGLIETLKFIKLLELHKILSKKLNKFIAFKVVHKVIYNKLLYLTKKIVLN